MADCPLYLALVLAAAGTITAKGVPVNFSSLLTTTGEFENVSDIRVSNKIPFNYTVVLPTGAHSLQVLINTSLDNTDNIFSMCYIDVIGTGYNIESNSTTNITWIQTTVGSTVSYKFYQAKIDFGRVLNTANLTNGNLTNGYLTNLTDSSASKIEMAFEVLVVNSSSYTTAAEYSVNVSAVLDDGNEILTEDAVFKALDSTAMWSAVPPLFNISGPSPVTIGDIVNWTITTNLRDAVNSLRVEAWVNGSVTYPACNIVLAGKGANYECLDPKSVTIVKTSDRARLDIPTIINTGFNDDVATSVSDDIVLEVLTKVPSFVNSSAAVVLNIEVYLDDKLVWSAGQAIQLIAGSLSTSNTVAALEIATLANTTSVAKGTAIIFTIDVTVGHGSFTPYTVTVETDAGLAVISSIIVTSAGDNLCMAGYLATTFSSTDSSATINKVVAVTDTVANMVTLDGANGTANQFRIEVVVCVPDYSAASVGSELNLTVDVLYEDVKTLSDSLKFNIGTTPSLAAGVTNFTNSTSPVGNISSLVTVSQLVEISPSTDWYNITVEVPAVGVSALATLGNVSVVFAGDNFACLSSNLSELSTVLISHTQVLQATYALGYVVNTGTSSRGLFHEHSPNDNIMEFQITLQILDHVVNMQNSLVNVTTTLTSSFGNTTSGSSYVAVDITGIERPQLIFDVNMDTYSMQKFSGDNVSFNVNIYHDVNSTAHAQNVTVHCMTPYYMGFGELLAAQGANITVQTPAPETGMKFEISEIDFNDNVSLSFSVVLDPGRVMPAGVVNLTSVVPVDMTYRGPIREDRADTGMLHSEVAVFSFTFDTENVGVIGMSSGWIQDCQITASSWINTNSPAAARLDTGLGWKPAIRGAPFCGEEYIQVNIGMPSLLTGVRVQSSVDDNTDLPTSFNIMYSDAGQSWVYIYNDDNVTPRKFSIGVPFGNSVSTSYDIDLTPRLTTQYIRLVPRSSQCLIGLRFELIGTVGSGPPVVCNYNSSSSSNTSLVQHAERIYVVNADTGTIFVCGPESMHGPVYCSRSDDGGDAWHGIDDTVSNVIGTITNTTIVVGLSHDGYSHLISFDDGMTWEVLSMEEVTSYKAQPGYLTAVEFPDDDMRSQTFDTIYSLFGMDGNDFFLTGCVDGIAVKRTGGTWQTKAWWGTQEASTMT